MFCPKCGTKALDGAGFCQKCGTKLIVDEPAGSSNQSGGTPKEAPAKKKSKKLPIIIGVAALVVLVIVFIAMNWEGSTDYEATVRAHEPFANSQGLPYTYGEVFDKYIPDAKWEVRESDDAAHVDIIGKAKGTDAEMVITIKVSLDAKDPDLASISPESVTVSGEKSPTEDEAVRFLLAMFASYDEGAKDLSGFTKQLDEAVLTTPEDVSLTETFTDADSGISFQYPAGWTFNEMVDYGVEDGSGISMVCLIADTNSSAQLTVQKITNPQFVNSLFSDDNEFLNTFGYNFDAANNINTSVEELHGIPIRKISYIISMADYETAHQAYIYSTGNVLYRVQFTCKSDEQESQMRIFEAIMDSYAITHLTTSPTPDLSSDEFPLATSTDALKIFDEWAAAHPMVGQCHLDLISDDTTDSSGEKAFLFTLETDGMGMFNISIRKSNGYMEYISKFETMSLDDWYAEWFSDESTSNILCYKGVSLTDWIGGPADTAYDVFGWPDYGTIIDGTLYSGGEYYGYNVGFDSGISFVIDYQTDRIGWITGAAEAIEVNGVTLNMTRAKLIDLFGAPESEEAVSGEMAGDEYYVMRYTIRGFPVEISMPNIDSAATAVMISQNSY